MHNATVEIFEPGDSGFDYDRLVELIGDRISFVPRYRQRIQTVPGRLANPVWVDDEHFDLGYHVRRSALPRPGTLDQLRELVARIVSRPLDRAPAAVGDLLRRGPRRRPGRAAVEVPPGARRRRRHRRPRPGPARRQPRAARCSAATSGARSGRPRRPSLVLDAVRDSVARPGHRRRHRPQPHRRRAARRPRPRPAGTGRRRQRPDRPAARRGSPRSSGTLSQQRRFVAVRTDLADYRKVPPGPRRHASTTSSSPRSPAACAPG